MIEPILLTPDPETTQLGRLMSTNEIAAYIGVSRVTIQNWIANDGFPRIKAGRLNRHDLAEVQAWLKHNTELADRVAVAKSEEHQKLGRRDQKHTVEFTLD